MRLRRLVLTVLVLGLVVWGGYAFVSAGWSHLATQDMLDKALREAFSSHRMAAAAGTQDALDRWVLGLRASILLNARRSELPLDEDNISILLGSSGAVRVTIKWSYPIVTWGGENILVVPLSVHRSVPLN